MIAPREPANEKERQKDLESYSILNSLPEEDYNDIAAIAAQICGTPISLISLIDNKRQWFKSAHGINASETPREYAFCAHAINDPENVFVIQDARTDERFNDNPLVTGDPFVIFYAGVPLVSDEGFALGTLCVIDHKPNLLNPNQIRSLSALSNQVMNLLKLRKSKRLLEESLKDMADKNLELERFASVAAHDLKSPLISILGLAQFFSEKYNQALDEDGQKIIQSMISSSERLRRLIDGLLDYSRSENLLLEEKSKIDPIALSESLATLFASDQKVNFELNSTIAQLYANRTAVDQILINLVANAIKYNDKNVVEIKLGILENYSHYEFYVRDNGPGIAEKYQKQIFEIFEILEVKDKFGQRGNGIGLATVKKLVEKMGGSIIVESSPGQGAKFTFTLEK